MGTRGTGTEPGFNIWLNPEDQRKAQRMDCEGRKTMIALGLLTPEDDIRFYQPPRRRRARWSSVGTLGLYQIARLRNCYDR